jgi:hypothetical protein
MPKEKTMTVELDEFQPFFILVKKSDYLTKIFSIVQSTNKYSD